MRRILYIFSLLLLLMFPCYMQYAGRHAGEASEFMYSDISDSQSYAQDDNTKHNLIDSIIKTFPEPKKSLYSGRSRSIYSDGLLCHYNDTISHLLKADRLIAALELARQLYDASLEKHDSHGLFHSYLAFSDIYHVRGDTAKVVENIRNAMQYSADCKTSLSLTRLCLAIYLYSIPYSEIRNPEAESTLQRALDVARNREDTFLVNTYKAFHYARLRDTVRYRSILPSVLDNACPQYIDHAGGIYYRMLSYRNYFDGDYHGMIAERKKIANAFERCEAVYNIARFMPPYAPDVALVYADSVNMLYMQNMLRSNNSILLDFASRIDGDRLAASAAEQEVAYQAARLAAGKAQLQKEQLRHRAEMHQANIERLEQLRQSHEGELQLSAEALKKRETEMREQQYLRRRQQLHAEEHQYAQRRTVLTIGFVTLFAVLILLTILMRRYRTRAARISRLRDKEREMRDMAVKASQEKDTFIRSMSYDVRTPLNNVSGFAQLLAQPKDALSDEEREHFGQLIQNDSMRLIRYIEHLLTSQENVSLSEIEVPDQEAEERQLREKLREMNLLRIILPLVMLCAVPLFMTRQYAVTGVTDDDVLRNVHQLVDSNRTLEALRVTRDIRFEAYKRKDLLMQLNCLLLDARIFGVRYDPNGSTAVLREAIRINSELGDKIDPFILYCALFDHRSSYIGRDSTNLSLLDSASIYAVTESQKAEIHLRYASFHGLTRDTVSFKMHYDLYRESLNNAGGKLCADQLLGSIGMTQKSLAIAEAINQSYLHNHDSVDYYLDRVRDPYTRVATHYLVARAGQGDWRSLAYRDTIIKIRQAFYHLHDSIDQVYINQYLGSDSLRNAIVIRTRETNQQLLRQQELALQQQQLEAQNLRQEAEREQLQLSNKRKRQQLELNRVRMELSRREINRQKLAIYNASLDMQHAEQRFNIRILALSVAALLVIGVILAISLVRRRQDVRKKIRVSHELHNASIEAVHAMQMKNAFIQNMSHEIRTPLNAITGFSQLLSLSADTFTDDERQEFAMHIDNNIRLLSMLLDDIINIADIEKGRYSLKIRKVKVNEQPKIAMAAVRYRTPQSIAIRFTSDLPDSYTIQSDGKRIQQMLINYLTNAIKHTAEGSISIHVGRGKDEDGKPTICYSVSDTGEGIPPEEAENIFERFVKLNDFVQGTGLGLNICYNLAKSLGGRVWLDTSYPANTPGVEHGARFMLALPDKLPPYTRIEKQS